jgi:hypothetical protein
MMSSMNKNLHIFQFGSYCLKFLPFWELSLEELSTQDHFPPLDIQWLYYWW